MHGNVGEWCKDTADSYFPGNIIDPIGINNGSDDGIARGGMYNSNAYACRSAQRYIDIYDYSIDHVKYDVPRFKSVARELGFRLALIPTDYDDPTKTNIIPYFGIQVQSDLKGVSILKVVKDSPADKSGLKPMDIITKINGKTVKDIPGFIKSIFECEIDVSVEIKYLRNGISNITSVKLEPKPLQDYIDAMKK